ncbi:MAG: hypothetical protein HY395_00830 [Candidatus Doudnabacteria bacterium]|nr:hypothetical protein [Candidatus Doudnabacteria bacterium]
MDEIFDPNQRDELNEHLNETPAFSFRDFIKKNKVITGAVAAAVIAVAVAVLVLVSQKQEATPVSNNVFLSIKGPSQISSGNEAEYRIVYRNGENSDLVSGSLELFYPSGSKFKSAVPAPLSSNGNRFTLPVIKAGSDGEVKVRIKISGATAEDKVIAAKFNYKLADFNSEFEVKAEARTLVLAPNLTLDITGPIDVTVGQDTTFVVNYSNVSNQDFDNLVLQLQYPEGVDFVSSSPKPSKDQNIFSIPRLAVSESGRIEVTATFNGDANQEKLIIAELGQLINNTFAPQLSTSAVFKIVAAPMSLKITAEPMDVVDLGDTIEFNVEYANQSSIGMTNVVITVNLESSILDLSRVTVYDAIVTGSTITWKSATLSNLSVLGPNQKGEITFRAPVRSNLTSNVKNLTVRASGTIKSDQMPNIARASEREIKLTSEMNLLVSGKYLSGAAPMKVGQSTTFAVTFLVTNTSNDIIDSELRASLLLPANAWSNIVVPEQEKSNLVYDPNSGIIKWKTGSLPAFTGKFTPARLATFQLVVTPTESDKGKSVKLLSDVGIEGLDTFTNLPVKSDVISDFATDDLDDEVFDQKGSAVQ